MVQVLRKRFEFSDGGRGEEYAAGTPTADLSAAASAFIANNGGAERWFEEVEDAGIVTPAPSPLDSVPQFPPTPIDSQARNPDVTDIANQRMVQEAIDNPVPPPAPPFPDVSDIAAQRVVLEQEIPPVENPKPIDVTDNAVQRMVDNADPTVAPVLGGSVIPHAPDPAVQAAQIAAIQEDAVSKGQEPPVVPDSSTKAAELGLSDPNAEPKTDTPPAETTETPAADTTPAETTTPATSTTSTQAADANKTDTPASSDPAPVSAAPTNENPANTTPTPVETVPVSTPPADPASTPKITIPAPGSTGK